MANRTEKVIKNSSWGLIVQLVQTLSSLLCRIIFVRCLNEAYLGIDGVFANVISILSVAELGFGSAITYELYSAIANHEDKQIAALMNLYKKVYMVIGAIIGIIGSLAIPFLNKFITLNEQISESLYLLYVLYLLNSVISYFFSYRESLLTATQNNYVSYLIKAGTIIMQNILQCVSLLLLHNFIIYLLIKVFFTFFYNLIVYIVTGEKYPILNKNKKNAVDNEQKKRIIKNVKYILVGTLASKLITSTDNIIITGLAGINMTGLNSNYALLSATLITITCKISVSISPGIGDACVNKNDDEKLKLFNEIHFVFFWLFSFCAIMFIFLSQDVVYYFFGDEYVLEFAIPLITGLNFYIDEEQRFVDYFLRGMGLFKDLQFVSLYTGITNIILSIILGRYMGLFGILFATFLSRLFITRTYLPYKLYKNGFHKDPIIFFRKDLVYLLELAVSIYLLYCLCFKINSSHAISWVLIRVVLGTVISNIVIIGCNFKSIEFVSLLNRLKVILKDKVRM